MRYNAFSIYLGETRWSGRWVMEGTVLHVESAYGWKACALGRYKPDNLARRLLLEILQAKLDAPAQRRAQAVRPDPRKRLETPGSDRPREG